MILTGLEILILWLLQNFNRSLKQFVFVIFAWDSFIYKPDMHKTYMQKTEAISLRSGIKRTLVGIFLWPCIHISEKDLSSML